mmetsp:Transcript_39882/g.77533  ORF Transcript_39882/g.77533 Transcript_39882/m.77533 type:complete len:191 (-) Transcript_39882:480-1052(-)
MSSKHSSRRSSLFASGNFNINNSNNGNDEQSALQQFITEVSDVFERLGWSEARSWSEFGREFNKPSELEERLWTNFLYYRGNYCYIVVATTLLALFLNPSSMLAAMFCVFGMIIFLGVKVETSPGESMSYEMKLLAGTPVCLLVLASAGALFWMAYGLLLGMLTSFAHMVFRTRTLKSRWNKLVEENTKM